MGYAARFVEAGGYYHLNSKAVDGTDFFRRDEDRAAFLHLLERIRLRASWSVLMYTLMDTHYHLLIRLREPTLSSGMQRLNSDYVRAYNRWHGRRGALVQRRFHDVELIAQPHLLETVRYIARNATRANKSERPEEYVWCSYGAAVGVGAQDPLIDEVELLGLWGTRLEEARRRLKRFVDEPDPRKRRSQIPL